MSQYRDYRALLTLGTLAMSFGVSSAANASNDMALSFELPPSPQAQAAAAAAAAEIAAAETAAAEAAAAAHALANAEAPLPIPAGAENPPMANDNSRPSGVYGGLEAVAIGSTVSVQALLPAPPPIPAYVQAIQTAIAPPPAPEPELETQQLTETDIQEQVALFIGIQEKTFESPADAVAAAPTPASLEETQPTFFEYSFDNFQTLFTGGTESLVARAVGSAEGTRTPEGHKNPAYYGHVDPGNGVWNLGTFSYQHGAASPEEADDKQLRRLKTQTESLRQKALAQGLQLTQEELLNGIDLANQAPLAALDRGGYIDWLKEAHNLGMQGSEAIIWARTRSFIDPDTQRWNAPGLGNNIYSISHDQERRANAIARAVAAFNAQTQVAIAPAPVPNDDLARNEETKVVTPERIVDSVPLTLGDAFAGKESTADAVAQAPVPEGDESATVPTLSEETESGVVAMAAPAASSISSSLSTGGAIPSSAIADHSPRRLGRLGQTLSNFLTRNEPDAASRAASAPAMTEAAAMNATPPITTSERSATHQDPSDSAIESQPTETVTVTPPSTSTSSSVSAETAEGPNQTTPEALSSGDAAKVSEPESAATPATPPSTAADSAPISFEATSPSSEEETIPESQQNKQASLTSPSAPQNTTAPADMTDAEDIKQRTLASLDRLQSILRAEAEADSTQP